MVCAAASAVAELSPLRPERPAATLSFLQAFAASKIPRRVRPGAELVQHTPDH